MKTAITSRCIKVEKKLLEGNDITIGKHYAYCNGKMLEVDVRKRPNLKVLRNRLSGVKC